MGRGTGKGTVFAPFGVKPVAANASLTTCGPARVWITSTLILFICADILNTSGDMI
jgi:hypothetical protein